MFNNKSKTPAFSISLFFVIQKYVSRSRLAFLSNMDMLIHLFFLKKFMFIKYQELCLEVSEGF